MLTNIATVVRWTGVLVLGVAVLIAPWCYGSIHASTQVWLFPCIMISLVCGMVTLLLDGKTRWSFPILLIPVLLMLLLIGLQLWPHDHESLAKQSPKVAELRSLLLPAPDSEEYRFTREICPEAQCNTDPAPTSIFPAITRHQLALFVLVVSAFFAALVLFRDRYAIYLFGMVAVLNGCALAMLGIVMRLNPRQTPLFYWDNTRTTFCTFVNRNNAAGYLGMCLGIAVIFLLWYFFRSDREIEDSRRWDKRYERAYMTTKQILAYRFSRMLNGGGLIFVLFSGLLIAGILASMSRGGSLAMALALLIAFLVLFATRRFKLSMLGFALVGMMGAGLIFWAGMDERVQQRLETILTGDNSARPRNWSNAIETARDFQWRGTGFGTYQYANLLNDEFAKDNLVFVRAENQYIEIFLDLGPWGFLLLLVCLVTAIALCWRLIWQQKDDWLTALGGGLLVAIMTQAVASLFDFGLYITANALLLAVCCGILSAVSPSTRPENGDKNRNVSLWNSASRIVLLATGGLFLVLTHWGSREIGVFHRVDQAMNRLAQIGSIRSAEQDEIVSAIEQLEAAVRQRNGDAIAARALAETQIALYRRTMFYDLHGELSTRLPENEILNRTSLLSVHADLGLWRRLDMQTQANIIREYPAVDEYLRPAFANLVRSRQANPMDFETHFAIAQLIPILDKKDSQAEFEQNAVQRITTVAPLSAKAWYQAGILEKNMGRSANARAYWKQSLTLSRLYLAPIVELTKKDLRGSNAKRIFQETFPNSPDLFLVLVTRHFTYRQTPDFADAAMEVLKHSCETADDISEGERHYYRGRYEMLMQQYDAAIAELKAACAAQRTNHAWQYQLALACYSNRRYEEAEKAIDSALYYDPKNQTYLKFRDNIRKAKFTN